MNATALIYIRQSRHKDYERTASPEVQEQACRELPAVQSCDEIISYTDLDVSGGRLQRRARWQALRERLDASTRGERLVLALYDQSRAFRNTADALELYALLERKPWIDVALVHGRFDRSAAGEFTYTAMAAAHAMERRMTAEKIRAAKAYRSAQGEAVGPLPLGYKWIGTGADRHVSLDDAAAPVIERLFKEYATGRYSARVLSARLNSEGVFLDNSGAARHRIKGWTATTLNDILLNVAYTGRTYSVSRRRREGELIEAQWPALIDIETWEKTQALKARYHHHENGRVARGLEPHSYVFQKLLVCVCGRRMEAKTAKGRAYYHCRGTNCHAKGAREDRLLPWPEAVFRAMAESQPHGFTAAVREQRARVDHEPQALANIDGQLRRLRDLYVRFGDVSQKDYEQDRDNLLALRSEIESRQERPVSATLQIDGVWEAWQTGNPDARRKLLSLLFDSVLFEDGEITGWTPRADRTAEVVRLMESLVGVRLEGLEPPTPSSGNWCSIR
jgi:DNA invertase Pin-like site-specific DNA recombinase